MRIRTGADELEVQAAQERDCDGLKGGRFSAVETSEIDAENTIFESECFSHYFDKFLGSCRSISEVDSGQPTPWKAKIRGMDSVEIPYSYVSKGRCALEPGEVHGASDPCTCGNTPISATHFDFHVFQERKITGISSKELPELSLRDDAREAPKTISIRPHDEFEHPVSHVAQQGSLEANGKRNCSPRAAKKYLCQSEEAFWVLDIQLNEIKKVPISRGRCDDVAPRPAYLRKNLSWIIYRRGKDHWSLDNEVKDALEDAAFVGGTIHL